MNKNEQTPAQHRQLKKQPEQTQKLPSPSVRTSLIAVCAALVIGTAFYVWSANNNTNKTIDNTRKAAKSTGNAGQTDAYAGWKSYTWADQGLSFKYPSDWVVNDTSSSYRVYVRNSDVDLTKESTPENFQQVWLSVDVDDTSVARENAIKNGESDFRIVDGQVSASTMMVGGMTVNTYAYNTTGGPTLEAYWTNKAGVRLMATTSTEVGQQNQTDMVATLKKLLASMTVAQ